ncbi:MAG TPA: hypothetical protein DEO38_00010 [Bacteroidales bacterium]|nr:hypothetical protein [Bacteroidales bacterium]
MKRFLIFLLLLVSYRLFSSTPITMRFSGQSGYIMNVPAISKLGSHGPMVGGEVAVEFLPMGRFAWQQTWNNTSIGVAAGFMDFGQNKTLGQAITLYPYFNIPLVSKSHFRLTVRPGVGLGFVTKRYSNTVSEAQRWLSMPDDANETFGSILNAYFSALIGFEFPIRGGWGIEFAGGWKHLSNGSILAPNGGINIFSAELGLRYQPNSEQYTEPERKPDIEREYRKWTFEIIAAGGVRQLYYQDRKKYGIAALSVAAFYQPCRIFRLGLGADVFYDGVYGAINVGAESTTNYKKTYISSNDFKNKVRMGISLQPEFVFGNFSAGIYAGIYLYDNIKNLEPFDQVKNNNGKPLKRGIFYKYSDPSNHQDGWFYTKAVAKYCIKKHYIISVALKTHLQKAECIEWGFGYRY